MRVCFACSSPMFQLFLLVHSFVGVFFVDVVGVVVFVVAAPSNKAFRFDYFFCCQSNLMDATIYVYLAI